MTASLRVMSPSTGLRGRTSITNASAHADTGTVTQKHQRQPACSARTPPRSGPTAKPNATTTPMMPWYFPLQEAGGRRSADWEER